MIEEFTSQIDELRIQAYIDLIQSNPQTAYSDVEQLEENARIAILSDPGTFHVEADPDDTILEGSEENNLGLYGGGGGGSGLVCQ